jgi:hypothetical protein
MSALLEPFRSTSLLIAGLNAIEQRPLAVSDHEIPHW